MVLTINVTVPETGFLQQGLCPAVWANSFLPATWRIIPENSKCLAIILSGSAKHSLASESSKSMLLVPDLKIPAAY